MRLKLYFKTNLSFSEYHYISKCKRPICICQWHPHRMFPHDDSPRSHRWFTAVSRLLNYSKCVTAPKFLLLCIIRLSKPSSGSEIGFRLAILCFELVKIICFLNYVWISSFFRISWWYFVFLFFGSECKLYCLLTIGIGVKDIELEMYIV